MLVVPRRAAVFRDHGCIYVNPGSALTITAALIYAMRGCLLTAGLALSFGSTVLGRLRFCAGIDGRAAGMGKVAKGSVSRTTARPPVRRACGFCTALNRFLVGFQLCVAKTPVLGVHLRLEPCSHRSRAHEEEPKPRRLSAFSAALRAARPQPPAVVLPSTRSAIEALAPHVALLSRRSLLITLGLPIPAVRWMKYRPRPR